MKPHSDPNQGEGDKVSARHYNRAAREFVADGKVDEAAHEAKVWVEGDPVEAERAERKAARGPRRSVKVSVSELVDKGRSVVDRLRPVAEQAVTKVRSVLHRNK
jgi:hypothetical protein